MITADSPKAAAPGAAFGMITGDTPACRGAEVPLAVRPARRATVGMITADSPRAAAPGAAFGMIAGATACRDAEVTPGRGPAR